MDDVPSRFCRIFVHGCTGRMSAMAERKCRAFAFAACLFGLLTSSNAAASVDWLLSQQQADGSVASTADTATPFQTTSEAVKSLRLLGRSASTAAPQSYLAAQTYHGTEYLSRKVIAAAESGAAFDGLLTELLAHQNPDGGFGEFAGFHSTSVDTAFALEALATTNPNHSAAGFAIGFLLQTQNSDGGWSINGATSDVYVTSLTTRALYAFRTRFAAVPSIVSSASNFVLSRRGADALWGEDLLSAQALLTLSTVASDVAVLQQSATALRAHSSPATGWNGDVYTTAVALRALYVFDARAGGATIPISGGAVTGYVLRSGTSQPIEGASVTASSGAQAQTNSEGYFVLNNVTAGSVTLKFQEDEYERGRAAGTVNQD